MRTMSALLLLAACGADPAPLAPTPVALTSPHVALDRLDGRSPVPLLPMMAHHQKQSMREHLEAVQAIVQALAVDDLAAVERAATTIGYSETMGRMCSHMGAGAPGFTDQAVNFHRSADRIGDAARAGDRARVLAELGTTLQTCTACHQTWKQQIVDEAQWQRLTTATQ